MLIEIVQGAWRLGARLVAIGLVAQEIFAWGGAYYALTLMEWPGLEDHGGVRRLGLAHYNTTDEVDRIVAALREIVGAA
jgi:selenocysteine lyase/cysteine desulfurase